MIWTVWIILEVITSRLLFIFESNSKNFRMERKQNSVESNRLMDGNIYVLNVATPTPRGEPTRGSGRGARPLDQPPPIPPPPPSIPPPPPPPKDYPSAPPFVGKPPTSQTVNRLKSQFEQRHWSLGISPLMTSLIFKTLLCHKIICGWPIKWIKEVTHKTLLLKFCDIKNVSY